jgi:type III secretion system FlhB-like substrate exporter
VHKKAKFRNLASDWENFRRIRNEIIDMIREAKKQYIIKLQNSLIDKSIPPKVYPEVEHVLSFLECKYS